VRRISVEACGRVPCGDGAGGALGDRAQLDHRRISSRACRGLGRGDGVRVLLYRASASSG
jgi:hypothetical protein